MLTNCFICITQMKHVANDIYQQNSMIGEAVPRFMSNFQDSNSNSFDGFSLYPTSASPKSLTLENHVGQDSKRSNDQSLNSIQQASNGVKQLKPELVLQELSDR